jgi:hypothetical protein
VSRAEVAAVSFHPAIVAHAWPVIVTSHPFPHREWIIDAVPARVRREGHLTDERIGGLLIVSTPTIDSKSKASVPRRAATAEGQRYDAVELPT